MNRKILVLILVFTLSMPCFQVNTFGAGNTTITIGFDAEGTLIFTTEDRKAIVPVKYKTIGWTIYSSDRTKHTILMLEEAGHVDLDNNMVQTTFKTDKDTIFKRIGEADKAWQNDLYRHGGTVILDGIFTIVEGIDTKGGLLNEGSSDWGEVYYKLRSGTYEGKYYKGIRDARSWMTPSDFDDYYDKQLPFKVDGVSGFFDEDSDSLPNTINLFLEDTTLSAGTSSGQTHVKYFTDTGTPLSTYDNDLTMVSGSTYSINNKTISGYEFVGSKIAYGSLPSGTITPGAGSYTFTYSGAYTDAYIYYYYKSTTSTSLATTPSTSLGTPPTMHVHYFTDTGIPLEAFNTDLTLINGNSYNITNSTINGYDFVGSQIAYGSIPTGSITPTGSYNFTYSGAYTDGFIYYYYKHKVGTIGLNGMSASPSAVIKADDRGAELYDTTKGIPTTKDLYVNVLGKSYLYDYDFVEMVGTKSYTVEVNKTYNLTWQQDDGGPVPNSDWVHPSGCIDANKDGKMDTCPGHPSSGTHWQSNWNTYSDTQTVTNTYTVARDYSYWQINSLSVFGLDKAVINNTALPSGSVTLTPNGYTAPTVDTWHSTLESDHMVAPVTGTKTITLPATSLDGGTSGRPGIPTENWYDDANAAVGQIKVKNDKVIFNSQIVMTDTEVDYNTQDPLNMPASPIVDNNTLFKKDLTLEATRVNGNNNSTGIIYYTRLAGAINPSQPSSYSQSITGINPVVVHTPVVCDGGILNDINFDQSVAPDTTRASVLLGKSTKVRLLTEGAHKNILGYGNKDYEAYTSSKQVKFPFDVYVDTTTQQKSKYLAANTWYTVPLAKDDLDIYMPTWVSEGDYTIEYRSIAINAPNDLAVEGSANLDLTHYVATDSSNVKVIGRVYGFKITDIEDYPLWESVFRTSKGSFVHTSNYFYSGNKNENGYPITVSPPFTLPILKGSHPDISNEGALATGYSFKFELETIGNYYGDKDCLNIVPTFYYISKDGKNRKEVDLWYSEYFNDKNNYFIKFGSEQDKLNTKYITIGDADRNVPAQEITDSSTILGLTEAAFRSTKSKIGWFYRIVLSKSLRTFAGDTSNLPTGVNATTVKKSVQHWFGEYYLPNDLYVAPKGYDVINYASTNNGLDGKEGFWLKDGYIVVNFDCKTVQNGDFDHQVLSYYKAVGANMWQIEGYQKTKVDSSGATFNLEDGDIVFYEINHKSSEDYTSGGTH